MASSNSRPEVDRYLSPWQVGVLFVADPKWAPIAEFAHRNLPVWHGYYHQSHPPPAPYRGGASTQVSTAPSKPPPTHTPTDPQTPSSPTKGSTSSGGASSGALSKWKGVSRDPQHGVPFEKRRQIRRGIDTVGAAIGMGPRFREFSSPHYFLEHYGLYTHKASSDPQDGGSSFKSPAFNPHVLAGVALLHYRLAGNALTYLGQLNAQFPNVRAEGNPNWTIPLRPQSTVDELAHKNLDVESNEAVQRHEVLKSPKLRTLILATLWESLPKDGRHQLAYDTFLHDFLTPVLSSLCFDIVGVTPGQPLPSSLVHDVVAQDWFLRTEFGETAALDPNQFAYSTVAMLDAWVVTNTFEEFSELVHVMTVMVKSVVATRKATRSDSASASQLSLSLMKVPTTPTTSPRSGGGHTSVLESSIIKRRQSCSMRGSGGGDFEGLGMGDADAMVSEISLRIDADGAHAERKRRPPLPTDKADEMLVAGIIQYAIDGEDADAGGQVGGGSKGKVSNLASDTTKSLVSFVRSLTSNVQRYDEGDDDTHHTHHHHHSAHTPRKTTPVAPSYAFPLASNLRPESPPVVGPRRSITFTKAASELSVHSSSQNGEGGLAGANPSPSLHATERSTLYSDTDDTSSSSSSDSSDSVERVVGTLLRRQQSVALLTRQSVRDAQQKARLAKCGVASSSKNNPAGNSMDCGFSMSLQPTESVSDPFQGFPLQTFRSEVTPTIAVGPNKDVHELYAAFMRRHLRKANPSSNRLAKRLSRRNSSIGKSIGELDQSALGQFATIINPAALMGFQPVSENTAKPPLFTVGWSPGLGASAQGISMHDISFMSAIHNAPQLEATLSLSPSPTNTAKLPHTRVMALLRDLDPEGGLLGRVQFKPPSKMSSAFNMWGPSPMNINAHSTYVMGAALGDDTDDSCSSDGDVHEIRRLSISSGVNHEGTETKKRRPPPALAVSPRCFAVEEIKWKCDCGFKDEAPSAVGHKPWCATLNGKPSLGQQRQSKLIPLLLTPVEAVEGVGMMARSTSISAAPSKQFPYIHWYLVPCPPPPPSTTEDHQPVLSTRVLGSVARHTVVQGDDALSRLVTLLSTPTSSQAPLPNTSAAQSPTLTDFVSLALSVSELNFGGASPLPSAPQGVFGSGPDLLGDAIPLSLDSCLRLTLAYLIQDGEWGVAVPVTATHFPESSTTPPITATVDPLSLKWEGGGIGGRGGIVVGVVHNGAAWFEYASDNRLAWCPIPSATPLSPGERPPPQQEINMALTKWVLGGVEPPPSQDAPPHRLSTSTTTKRPVSPGAGSDCSRPSSKGLPKVIRMRRCLSSQLVPGVDTRCKKHFLCADVSGLHPCGSKGGRVPSRQGMRPGSSNMMGGRLRSGASTRPVDGGEAPFTIKFSLMSLPVVETQFSSVDKIPVPKSLEGKDVSVSAIAGAIAKGTRNMGDGRPTGKKAPLTQPEAELMLHLMNDLKKSTATPDQTPADLPQEHKDAHIAPVRASVVVIAPMDRHRELETVLQREMRQRGIGGGLLSLNSTACGQDPRKEAISIAYTRKGLPIPAFLSHSAAEDGAFVVADNGGNVGRDVVSVQPLLHVDGTDASDEGRLESLVYIPLNLLVSRTLITTSNTAPPIGNGPPSFFLSQSTDGGKSLLPSPSLPPLMGVIPPQLQQHASTSPSPQTASMRVEVPAVPVSAASLPWRTITRDPTAVPSRTVDPTPTKRHTHHPHLFSSDSRQTRTSLRNWRSEKARGIQTPEVAASTLPSVEKMRAEKAAKEALKKGTISKTFHPQPCKK